MISMFDIKIIVQDYFKVNNPFDRIRTIKYVEARQAFCYAAYEYAGVGFDEVGNFISRDRVTAYYSHNKWKSYLQVDKQIKEKWKEIQGRIKEKIQQNKYAKKDCPATIDNVLIPRKEK